MHMRALILVVALVAGFAAFSGRTIIIGKDVKGDGIKVAKGAGLKTVMVVYGTRPEAIKLAPLIRGLAASERLKPLVVVTGQHREMLDQVLEVFEIRPDVELVRIPSDDGFTIAADRFAAVASGLIGLADRLLSLCDNAGIAPGRIVLELTESSAMTDPAARRVREEPGRRSSPPARPSVISLPPAAVGGGVHGLLQGHVQAHNAVIMDAAVQKGDLPRHKDQISGFHERDVVRHRGRRPELPHPGPQERGHEHRQEVGDHQAKDY